MLYEVITGQPAGFEYELAKAFADYLGVRLELVIPTTYSDLFETMREHNAHIAASNLIISKKRQEQFDFGPAYRITSYNVCYTKLLRPFLRPSTRVP